VRESYFQKKFCEQLKAAHFVIFNLSDKFTSGIPDVYCARDGVSHWYELKVVNKAKGMVDLSDSSGTGHGFTKAQKINIYKLRQAGVDAWGIVHVAPHKKTVKIPPEDFERRLDVEELLQYEEFSIENT
jgi:hypothetical protein